MLETKLDDLEEDHNDKEQVQNLKPCNDHSNEEIESSKDLVKKVYKLTRYSLVYFFLLLILITPLTAAQLIIGFFNLKKCPLQEMIPIWLITTGTVSIMYIILKFVNTILTIVKRKSLVYLSVLRTMIIIFQVAWFIAGNVWVYSIVNLVDYDGQTSQHCDQLMYKFSFWYVTSVYIAIGLAITCLLMFFCFYAFVYLLIKLINTID